MLAATPWWEVAGAAGAVVGGVGAAVGGISAWRASTAARATSRDALEALAVGIEPRLHADLFEEPRTPGGPLPGPTRMTLNVRNSARWSAGDVHMGVTYGDGKVLRHHAELLDPMADNRDLNIPLRDVTPAWPPHAWEPVDVVVRFSDVRGPLPGMSSRGPSSSAVDTSLTAPFRWTRDHRSGGGCAEIGPTSPIGARRVRPFRRGAP
jgi:hypothetical protein